MCVRPSSNCLFYGVKGQFLHSRNGLHLFEPAPWKPQHQGIKLLLCQRDGGGHIRASAWPFKPALIEPPRGTPQAKAVVQEQLDAVASCVGKQVAVMSLC